MAGGGGGAQVYLTPDRPVTPQDAGMAAVDQYLSGRRFIAPDRAPDTTFLPEARQNIADTASRFARTAGKYGGLAAALGGGLKNLYDQTASGEPLSATSLGTGALAGYQFARPLATRAGAQLGTRVGVRQAGPPAGSNYQQGAMAQPFNIPQGADMSMFNAAPPVQIPSMSYQDFQNEIGIRPNMTFPPAQSPQIGTPPVAPMTTDNSRQMGLGEFTPPGQDMRGALQSSLPGPNETIDASMQQMKEQQKEAKEKKEEMDEKQREELSENINEQRDNPMGV